MSSLRHDTLAEYEAAIDEYERRLEAVWSALNKTRTEADAFRYALEAIAEGSLSRAGTMAEQVLRRYPRP